MNDHIKEEHDTVVLFRRRRNNPTLTSHFKNGFINGYDMAVSEMFERLRDKFPGREDFIKIRTLNKYTAYSDFIHFLIPEPEDTTNES